MKPIANLTNEDWEKAETADSIKSFRFGKVLITPCWQGGCIGYYVHFDLSEGYTLANIFKTQEAAYKAAFDIFNLEL